MKNWEHSCSQDDNAQNDSMKVLIGNWVNLQCDSRKRNQMFRSWCSCTVVFGVRQVERHISRQSWIFILVLRCSCIFLRKAETRTALLERVGMNPICIHGTLNHEQHRLRWNLCCAIECLLSYPLDRSHPLLLFDSEDG